MCRILWYWALCNERETTTKYVSDNGTSTVTFPKNKPVKPPFKNVTMNAKENNIGKVN